MSEPEVVSLEDDAPIAPVAETPAPAPAAPDVPVAPDAQPAEVEAVEVGGQKYVPLSGLIELRKEKQALKQAADKAAQLEAELAQARPYVDFLKANPQLTQRQPEPQAPAQPVDDPDALEAARLMDFYKTDGNLDAEKGARWLALQDKRAGRVAQQTMQPTIEHQHQRQSAQNYHQVLNTPGANGLKPDVAVLNELWSRLPARLTQDQGVAAALHAMALGFTKAPAASPAAPPPAIVSEPAGGNPNARPALSQLERNVAAVRGVDDKKWMKLSEGFSKGRTSALED